MGWGVWDQIGARGSSFGAGTLRPVKLCQFEVINRPGDEIRSGLFHEGKVYETDGQNAIAVHDPANVRFLSPVGRPSVVRCFESYQAGPGEHALSYFFMNPTVVAGPGATVEVPPSVENLDLEVRVFGVTQDSGMMIDEAESDGFLLGYGFMVVLVDRDLSAPGMGGEYWASSRDVGAFVSPFIVTPEELTLQLVRESKSKFEWTYEISVEGETIADKGQFGSDYAFSDLLYLASRRSAVSTGEVVTWPALPKPDIELSRLSRYLMPGDAIKVVVEGLGAVTARIG